MIPFLKRRAVKWLSIAMLFFVLPAGALAAVSFSWSPTGATVKSPITVSVSTTGSFQDTVDGIGCDVESYTNWTLHVVGAIGELFGDVMSSDDKISTYLFTLPLGLYTADIACSEAPVQQNNGQSNNPSLFGNFEVIPWHYLRTPSGLTVSSAALTVEVAFDNFADTGCSSDAESWRVSFYNATGEYIYASSPYIPKTTLNSTFTLTGMQGGDYGTAEIECLWNGTEYGGSVFLENGNGSTIFTVPYNVHRDEEVLPALTGDAVRPLPTVTFASPKKNDRAGKVLKISYDVNFDNFDITQPYDVRGLAVNAVSLYYAHEKDGLASTTLIAKDLLAKGEYVWEVHSMPEGDDYQIVIIATDNVGRVTTLSSENFSIDHTPPAFRISVNPPVSEGEEVTISVDAEESLDAANPPRVHVEQQFAGPITLTASGSGKHFETIYYPVLGHDGEVKITVKGKDLAGNEGDKIVSGGLFYVGIEPPPKPVITYPLENDIFSGGTTSVKGVSRVNTEVSLFANGTLVSKKSVDSEGAFLFNNVPVNKDFQRGINVFAVVAYDKAGHQSESAVVRVKYNTPPTIAIAAPKGGEVLSRARTIRVEVRDENNDPILFTYEASDDNGATWITLAKNIKSPELKWRTMDFLDGEYILRVTADDGSEKVVATSGEVRVRNYLPRVEFDGKQKTVTNKNALTISGSASAEKAVGITLSPITNVEYRINGEKTWHTIAKSGGSLGEFNRNFAFDLSDLSEGVYGVEVRATDERGYHGISTKVVIVDFGPPQKPQVTYPLLSAVIANTDDEDKERAGVQFTVRGKSEPHSIVEISVLGGIAAQGQTATSGEFVLPGVTLRNHGENALAVTATDIAGNTSSPHSLKIAYNNPPTIRFRTPRAGRGLNNLATVRFEVSDIDGDAVLPVTLSWRLGNSGPYQKLATNVKNDSVAWDVSKMTESKNYELKIDASDGTSVSALSQKFTIDNTPPNISLIPLPHTGMRKEFVLIMEGDASDELSGVEYVEYSINGKEWYKGVITKGYLGKDAHFRVKHPFVLVDGKYTLQFRAVDGAGIVSLPRTQQLVVDTIPPHIGSFTLGAGTTLLSPTLSVNTKAGLPKFQSIAGESLLFGLSLEEDTASATLQILKMTESSEGGIYIPLTQDARTRLWFATIPIATAGEVLFRVSATDRLGNMTDGVEIGIVDVRVRGAVRDIGGAPIEGASVSVQVFNEDKQEFTPWNGKPYGLWDKKETNASGAYAILLPSGTYRLLVQKVGFERVRSSDFTIDVPQFVSPDFTLRPREGIRGMLENVIDFLSPS